MHFTKTIFLTGFPGFIGERLVRRLSLPTTQFFLLVQPQFVEPAMQAVERIAAATGTPLENFCLIRGDITKPQLGAGDDDWSVMRSETTDVFHLAAAYDLAVDKETAYRVNVEGTKNVNDFVRSVWGLHRYNYVSTCYVAGKRTGVIKEDDLSDKFGFRNFYEETKYLAEVETEALKAEKPVTIFRPSVVVGDSRTGETAKYDGIYYLIKFMRKAPSLFRLVNVGNADVRLNLVPLDFVVESIAVLADDEKAAGKTVALADPAPMTTAELFDVIAENLSGKRSAFTPPPAVANAALNLPVSPPLTGLPIAAVPYFFLSQMYDTSVAEELLEPYGIKCPPFTEYVKNLLDFVRKHPKL